MATVTHTYTDYAGDPLSGRVTFTEYTEGASRLDRGDTTSVDLDGDGAIEADLDEDSIYAVVETLHMRAPRHYVVVATSGGELADLPRFANVSDAHAWTAAGAEGPRGPKGEKGDDGKQGPEGEKGEPGEGVPSGGTEGQLLTKASGDDYDTEWADAE